MEEKIAPKEYISLLNMNLDFFSSALELLSKYFDRNNSNDFKRTVAKVQRRIKELQKLEVKQL